MVKRVFYSLVALTFVNMAAAHASVFRYDYQGQPMICGDTCEWAYDSSGNYTGPFDAGTLAGHLTIDKSLFGADAFLDAVLHLNLAVKEDNTGHIMSYDLSSALGSTSRSFDIGFSVDWSLTGFIKDMGGVVGNALSSALGFRFDSYYYLYFDGSGEITAWNGFIWGGGSSDTYSRGSDGTQPPWSAFLGPRPDADITASGAQSATQGAWTKQVVPAVVPLPAPLALMGLGLLALAGTRALRRA